MSDVDAPSFTPELFAFMRELTDNNERTWFNANKRRYEDHVKEPALAFVEDIAYRLPEAAPQLVADKKALFRIYRDTRFAKDKTPYKTHVGIYLRHAQSADTETPGVYLHLEPRRVWIGAGIWHPSSAALKRLRTAIVNNPEGYKRAAASVAPNWEIADGEALKRAPVGYPADHPLIEDLKRKSFAARTPLTQKDATARGFLDVYEARLREVEPYMSWLCAALGVSY